MNRTPYTSIPLLAVLLPLAFASHAGAAPAAKDMAGPSRAVTDDIIDAVASEVERATVALRIAGEPPPYLINHKLTEVEVNDVVASLGSTTRKTDRHFVNLEARVHVGDYQLDNSNFVIANTPSTDGVTSITLPIEATPRIARRAAWLVTDAAYKEALEQLRAKIDTRRAGGAAIAADRPSYTRQEPLVQEEPVLVPKLEPLDGLEQRAQAISQVFRDMPHIRDSRVAFTSFLERRWYITNEGTRAHDTRRVSGVIVVATSQAQDGQHGQELALYSSRYGNTEADLPGDAELVREARKLAADLEALRTAPVIDRYIGPVLFEGAGAAGMVRNTLAPHLGGTPLPEGLSANEAKQLGGALADRVGLRVLSPLLSLVDDPTARRAGKQALIGGYQIDDEGVPAQRVEVADGGTLKALLGSRTPADKGAASNGHARRAAPGGVFHGSATNLFVNGKQGKSRAQLQRALLAEAKAQGLPYALIIRGFDDAAMTAAPELSTRELLHMFQTSDRQAPPIALLAYKVYPDGKEELVRGVQLRPVPIRAWRDIAAVGKDETVFNYLASSEHYLVHKINGIQEGGAVPSSGIESAVVTPDLLFKELDVVGSTTGLRPLPLVPPPAVKK